MKGIAVIGGVFVVLAAGALVMRGRQQAVVQEDETIPDIPIGTSNPAAALPAGKPGPPADLTKLYTWLHSESWGAETPANIRFYGTFFIFNEGNVPVHNLVAEVTLAFANDALKSKKFILPLKNTQDFWQRSGKGVLFPNRQSMPLNFSYELSLDYWRRDRMVSVRLIEGEKFEDRSNLEEPMQLQAFIREAPVAQIKQAFAKNPKLKEKGDGMLGLGPMQYALMQPDVEKVKLMESLGFDFNQPSGFDECAYHSAVFGGPKIIAYLASKKAKIRSTSDRKISPAHYATRQWDMSVFSALRKAGLSLDDKDVAGEPAIFYAVRQRDMDLTTALINAGAKTDAFNTRKMGLLGVAATLGSVDFFEKMTKALGRTTETGPDGNTLLHHTVLNHGIDMAAYLIKHGANPKAKNKQGKTPIDMLQSVTHEGDREILRSVLNNR